MKIKHYLVNPNKSLTELASVEMPADWKESHIRTALMAMAAEVINSTDDYHKIVVYSPKEIRVYPSGWHDKRLHHYLFIVTGE